LFFQENFTRSVSEVLLDRQESWEDVKKAEEGFSGFIDSEKDRAGRS
jgi:hypothetical protein